MTIECCEGMSGFTEIYYSMRSRQNNHFSDSWSRWYRLPVSELRVFDLALLLVWEAPFPALHGNSFFVACTRLMMYALYPYVNSGKEDSKRYWGIPFNDQNGCFCDRVLGSECKLLEVRKWVKYSKPPANRDSGTFFPPDFAWRDNQYFSSISRRRDNQRETSPRFTPNGRF